MRGHPILVSIALAATSASHTNASAPAGAEVFSDGVVQIALGGSTYSTVHVRLVVTNQVDDVPWTFDVESARLGARGDEASGPMLAGADVTTLPAVIVERGQRRTVDLYFPNPASPPYELVCQVSTPRRPMWVRVHLDIGTKERRAALPAGRAWWSDPAFPWTTYRHEDGAMAPHPPLPR